MVWSTDTEASIPARTRHFFPEDNYQWALKWGTLLLPVFKRLVEDEDSEMQRRVVLPKKKRMF